jgi:hypothetical protein
MAAYVRWYGPKVIIKLKDRIGGRVFRVGKFLKARIREEVSRPNFSGKFPSEPGEYPKRVSGDFRESIDDDYDRENIRTRVGSSMILGKWLEFGTDKMEPRPWLSHALQDYQREIEEILEQPGPGEDDII